jgi:uncharacterized protein YpmB
MKEKGKKKLVILYSIIIILIIAIIINYGFCVKDIHNDLQYPKNNECDITGRFLNETNKGIYQ